MQYISFKCINENGTITITIFCIGAPNTKDRKDLSKISQPLSGKGKWGAHVCLTPKLKSSQLHLLYCFWVLWNQVPGSSLFGRLPELLIKQHLFHRGLKKLWFIYQESFESMNENSVDGSLQPAHSSEMPSLQLAHSSEAHGPEFKYPSIARSLIRCETL